MSAYTQGGLTLPIAAGAAGERLTDPLLTTLLAYFSTWLNWGLSDKLEAMDGVPEQAVAATYDYDPGRNWVRLTTPALFAWRESETIEHYSTLRDGRWTDLRALYVFDERMVPHGVAGVSGLSAVVASLLARATAVGSHADYASGADVTDAAGIEGWEYQGAEFGLLSVQPGEGAMGRSAHSGTDGARQHGWPAVRVRWRVLELQSTSYVDATPTADSPLTVSACGVDVLSRVLEGADGTENGQP